MKKIDLKLVVTDDNDKDNTLSLFVPIQNGKDYVSSIDLLNTVGEFISKQLPNDNKNIFINSTNIFTSISTISCNSKGNKTVILLET